MDLQILLNYTSDILINRFGLVCTYLQNGIVVASEMFVRQYRHTPLPEISVSYAISRAMMLGLTAPDTQLSGLRDPCFRTLSVFLRSFFP
jgi:hypothetical protein